MPKPSKTLSFIHTGLLIGYNIMMGRECLGILIEE
jgi:hypothetical protein